MTSLDPALFPRRILLATIGLAPQIVTETLYALCVEQDKPFVPDEIHVLTTAEGAHRIRQTLLEPSQAHLAKFAEEYGCPGLAQALTPDRIHVISDAAGNPLADISTREGNAAAANLTVEVVQNLTADPAAALHVSIAGGRKTMGFLLGSAMTIFGRLQDRLSHVLVEPAPLELHPEFFYKPKVGRVLYDIRDKNRPINTADAKITLADIRFVRLRGGLPQPFLDGKWSYSETVERTQEAFAPRLLIDVDTLALSCGGIVVQTLRPVEFALYLMLALRAVERRDFIHWSNLDPEEFIAAYARLKPRVDDLQIEEQRESMKRKPLDIKDPRQRKFEETKSRITGVLKGALGPYCAPYAIASRPIGGTNYKAIGLDLPPEAIAFAPIPADEGDIEKDLE